MDAPTLEIASALLDAGANPNWCDDSGNGPLHSAVRKGALDIVNELIVKGADPNGPDSATILAKRFEGKYNQWASPLFLAVNQNELKIAELLISHGAAVDTPNGQTGVSSLYAAVSKRRTDWIGFLLSHGASPSYRAYNHTSEVPANDTPLHAAARNWDPQLISVLLTGDNYDINSQNAKEETPLSCACKVGSLAKVKALFNAGSSLNHKNLIWLTIVGAQEDRSENKERIQILKLLIEKGAAVDPEPTKADTPLSVAAAHGHLEITKALLEHGANPTRAIHQACWGAFRYPDGVEIVRLLVSHGADLARTANEVSTSIQDATPSRIIDGILEWGQEREEDLQRCRQIKNLLRS